MGLVALSGELVRVPLPRTDVEVVLTTKRGQRLEVGIER